MLRAYWFYLWDLAVSREPCVAFNRGAFNKHVFRACERRTNFPHLSAKGIEGGGGPLKKSFNKLCFADVLFALFNFAPNSEDIPGLRDRLLAVSLRKVFCSLDPQWASM